MAVTDPSALLPDQSTTGLPPSAVRIVPESTPRQSDQLVLRFFAFIRTLKGVPPDRGLWRELLALALPDPRAVVTHCGRSIAGSTVLHVGLAFYMRSNRAGIIDPAELPKPLRDMPVPRVLALDTGHAIRTVKDAAAVLRGWRCLRMMRRSRRTAAAWQMNLGGLHWPAVKARAKAAASGDTTSPLAAPTKTQLNLECAPSRPVAASYEERSGVVRGTESGICVPSGDTTSPLSGDTTSPQIFRATTEGLDQDQDLPPNPPKGGQAKSTVTRQPEDPAAVAAARDRYLAKLAEVAHGKGMTAPRPPRPALRRRHIVVAGLEGGGQCAVCGEVRPSRRAACPGPKEDR